MSRVFLCVAFRRECNMQAGPRRKTSLVNTPSLLHLSCLGFFGGGDLDERGGGCLREKSSAFERSMSQAFLCVAFQRKCNMQAGPRRKTSPVNTPSLSSSPPASAFSEEGISTSGEGCLREKSFVLLGRGSSCALHFSVNATCKQAPDGRLPP